MCWSTRVKELKPLIADKDIEVYKIVKCANEKFCIAYFQNYYYKTGADVDREIEMKIKGHYAYSCIGLHSYKSFTFVPDSTYSEGSEPWKSYCIGNNAVYNISVDNDKYLATFIIPKSATYFENQLGEIVSNHILYTGKYLKL